MLLTVTLQGHRARHTCGLAGFQVPRDQDLCALHYSPKELLLEMGRSRFRLWQLVQLPSLSSLSPSFLSRHSFDSSHSEHFLCPSIVQHPFSLCYRVSAPLCGDRLLPYCRAVLVALCTACCCPRWKLDIVGGYTPYLIPIESSEPFRKKTVILTPHTFTKQ